MPHKPITGGSHEGAKGYPIDSNNKLPKSIKKNCFCDLYIKGGCASLERDEIIDILAKKSFENSNEDILDKEKALRKRKIEIRRYYKHCSDAVLKFINAEENCQFYDEHIKSRNLLISKDYVLRQHEEANKENGKRGKR